MVVAGVRPHGTLPIGRACRSCWRGLSRRRHVAWRISRTPPAAATCRTVRPRTQRELRLIARRTWRFFETFVTAEDNSLAARQLPGRSARPSWRIAPRPPTSASIYCPRSAARDFGWCGLRDALDRIEAHARHHGPHAAAAAAISTTGTTRGTCGRSTRATSPRVDSGNLAAHLITLAGAFREWRKTPAPPAAAIAGLADALELCTRRAEQLPVRARASTHARLVESTFADLESQPAPPRPGRSIRTTNSLRDSRRQRRHPRSTWSRPSRSRRRSRNAAPSSCYLGRSRSPHHRQLAQRPARRATRPAFIVEHLETRPAPRSSSPTRWSSTSCSTRSASCCRSAIAPPTARSTTSCYDLLASEARLASFIAIAQGRHPRRHWFRLGRTVTPIGAGAALVSWSGSMFEYLMPDLVLRAPGGSLLAQTSRLIVQRQIAYGAELEPALGRFRIRLQRARPRAHLSILELRRARVWASSAASRRTR